MIGVNCLGVLNPSTGVDSVFLPTYKLQRPRAGDIAFITQSGGVGSTIIDMAAYYGMGISKFISYGNGTVLNEVDLLNYLEKDKDTKTIILYIEGTKDGRALFEAMKKVNRTKPIIALKAGRSGKASEAAMSHTGNIAGNYLAYKAAFRQAKVIEAETLEEVFDLVKIFSQPLPKGDRVMIVTNGGGLGVLATDAAEECGLKVPEFEEKTRVAIRALLPSYANVKNPLDLVADADVGIYEKVIEAGMQDANIDLLVLIALLQTAPMDERIVKVLTHASDDRRKPIATVSVGGEYTDRIRKALEGYGVPSYGYPESAVKVVKKFITYANYRRELKKE
jgi:acyl-CoA synthetase (NDP forming)